jgi:hypothetical protein
LRISIENKSSQLVCVSKCLHHSYYYTFDERKVERILVDSQCQEKIKRVPSRCLPFCALACKITSGSSDDVATSVGNCNLGSLDGISGCTLNGAFDIQSDIGDPN